MKDMSIIGAEEWCEFPSLGIPAIKARVDSGAKTSSLHAFNIEKFIRSSTPWVRFEVHPLQKDRKISIRCEAEIIDHRKVKNTSGISEQRYVIKSPMRLGEDTLDIELTLTNRDSMGYRMLLGREAMIDRFLINPSYGFVKGDRSDHQLSEMYEKTSAAPVGLRIGVLASNPDLYSNTRIMEAGAQEGHEMKFINVKQCYMKLDAEKPEVHYRGGKVLNDFDAVIPRLRPSVTFYGSAIIRQFESLGVYCQNSAAAITQSRDKLHSLQLLLQNGVNIPTTGFANSPLDTNDLIQMVGGSPLIVKLLEGTQGRGVVLAETKKAADSVINAFKSLRVNLLVQEFIEESKGTDIRCFVINGKVVAAMERRAKPGEFRANIHRGAIASAIKITSEERKMAIHAAKIMNLAVAGVDIIRSSRGPMVLEVNSSPGLEGIEQYTGKDVASLMIKAVERKLKWRV